MGVVYFSIIPTFEPSRYCKCWIVCFYYIFNYGNHNVAMTSLLQAVSSYIQRLLPACWGFPQAPRTAYKWSGYAFGSRTLNGCARTGIVHFGYIIIGKNSIQSTFQAEVFADA